MKRILFSVMLVHIKVKLLMKFNVFHCITYLQVLFTFTCIPKEYLYKFI